MPSFVVPLFAIGVLVVIVGFLVISTYNRFVALRNRIAKAWANIDVALKQRHDTLPNLVAAVRGLMAFERDVLDEVTAARAAYQPDASIPTQAATSEAATQAVRHLFAVVENYPEIKSAANVASLQAEIARLEDILSDRRELYNDSVFRYNTLLQQLPSNVVGALFGWKPEPMFAAEDAERERPAVDLT
jgi:LemA protein